CQSLMLDYSGRLNVRYAKQDGQGDTEAPTILPYLKSADFNLYVRPRSLYLNFVPEIYREVDFIGRLLKIFEQAFEPSVQALDFLWAYLNPLTAPEALLPFLAHWVGWDFSHSLTIERQRYLIHKAMEIYSWRGTRRGLRFYLHLYTNLPLDEDLPEPEKHISIQEFLGRGFITGHTELSQDSFIGGGKPYHFNVRLRFDHRLTTIEREHYEQLGRKIIEQEKPAFCTYNYYISY
ncbi:MAG: phage tail protein, partial [Moorea sp. SIO2B7]|nr:phage tail protein [Moorena sp. SIO2B7]